jgi:hypothetical protein
MVHELPVLSRHPREKGRQEILLANKFDGLHPLSLERPGEGAKAGCAELDYSRFRGGRFRRPGEREQVQ